MPGEGGSRRHTSGQAPPKLVGLVCSREPSRSWVEYWKLVQGIEEPFGQAVYGGDVSRGDNYEITKVNFGDAGGEPATAVEHPHAAMQCRFNDYAAKHCRSFSATHGTQHVCAVWNGG